MNLVVKGKPDLANSREIVDRQLRFTLAGLVKLTERMLGFADQRQWDQVEVLELARRQELEALKGLGSLESMDTDVAEAFAALLSINEQISGLVEREKQEILEKCDEGRSRNQAVSHYRSQ